MLVVDLFAQMAGYDCSRGLAKELDWPMSEDCSMVAHLRFLGAVPIVRTNVPQMLLDFVCANPTYGITLNPFDVSRWVRLNSRPFEWRIVAVLE